LLNAVEEAVADRSKRDVISGRGGADTIARSTHHQGIPRDSGGIFFSGTSEPRIDES
jgi:hypothetical protein